MSEGAHPVCAVVQGSDLDRPGDLLIKDGSSQRCQTFRGPTTQGSAMSSAAQPTSKTTAALAD